MVTEQAKKIGVYICSGCGIGEVLDLDKLSSLANKDPAVAVCKVHPFLCGEEGVQTIKKDIEEAGINTVVVAACSPRVNHDIFSFESCAVERVNLREQVAWSHEPGEETQELAEDYLRMGLTKAQKLEEPEPEIKPVNKTILVVGGGITGITAAVEAAEAGYDVILVEKNPYLGGKSCADAQIFPQTLSALLWT